jgi:TPR repeat protein
MDGLSETSHGKARWKMGLIYRAGYLGLEQNLVLAYVWQTLSFEAGYATAEQYRNRLSQEMTPAQIAEAERLVAEWEPNPAECEINSVESNVP